MSHFPTVIRRCHDATWHTKNHLPLRLREIVFLLYFSIVYHIITVYDWRVYFPKSLYAISNHTRCHYGLYSVALALEMTHHTLTERAAHQSLCVCLNTFYQHISPICLYLPPWTLAAAFICWTIEEEWHCLGTLRALRTALGACRHFIGNCHIALHSHAPMFFIVGGSASWSSRPNLKHMASIHAYPTLVGNPLTLSLVAVWHFLSRDLLYVLVPLYPSSRIRIKSCSEHVSVNGNAFTGLD